MAGTHPGGPEGEGHYAVCPECYHSQVIDDAYLAQLSEMEHRDLLTADDVRPLLEKMRCTACGHRGAQLTRRGGKQKGQKRKTQFKPGPRVFRPKPSPLPFPPQKELPQHPRCERCGLTIEVRHMELKPGATLCERCDPT